MGIIIPQVRGVDVSSGAHKTAGEIGKGMQTIGRGMQELPGQLQDTKIKQMKIDKYKAEIIKNEQTEAGQLKNKNRMLEEINNLLVKNNNPDREKISNALKDTVSYEDFKNMATRTIGMQSVKDHDMKTNGENARFRNVSYHDVITPGALKIYQDDYQDYNGARSSGNAVENFDNIAKTYQEKEGKQITSDELEKNLTPEQMAMPIIQDRLKKLNTTTKQAELDEKSKQAQLNRESREKVAGMRRGEGDQKKLDSMYRFSIQQLGKDKKDLLKDSGMTINTLAKKESEEGHEAKIYIRADQLLTESHKKNQFLDKQEAINQATEEIGEFDPDPEPGFFRETESDAPSVSQESPSLPSRGGSFQSGQSKKVGQFTLTKR